MKNNNLVILTGRYNFFGQTRKPWSSLNIDRIFEILQHHGYAVEKYEFQEVVNKQVEIRDKTVFYTFSHQEHYRQYIGDVLYFLSASNKIIPSYELFKCHENKGFQELYKRAVGLNGLKSNYFSFYEDVDFANLNYPVVLKTVKGSNGKGVFLIRNKKDFLEKAKKLLKGQSLAAKVDLFRRKYFRKKKFKEYPDFSDRKDYVEYREYIKIEENFVLQEFVPGLSFDYRVLIAFDRFYVTQRSVNKGDFRASGTKRFGFSKTPDPGLLNYAKAVYDRFDTPFLSIDVLYDGKEYYLAEYQALHFGVNVIVKSEGYFQSDENGQWLFVEDKPVLEDIFSRTLMAYLDKS